MLALAEDISKQDFIVDEFSTDCLTLSSSGSFICSNVNLEVSCFIIGFQTCHSCSAESIMSLKSIFKDPIKDFSFFF